MKKLTVMIAALAATALAAQAQEPGPKPEIRPFVGMYVPTGDQRDLFENAAMYGLQAALEFRPDLPRARHVWLGARGRPSTPPRQTRSGSSSTTSAWKWTWFARWTSRGC